jgi:hypothetical protein
MQKTMVTLKNGITQIAFLFEPLKQGESDQMYLERMAGKDFKEAEDCQLIDIEGMDFSYPQDWDCKTKKLNVNWPKAYALKLEDLELLKTKRLEEMRGQIDHAEDYEDESLKAKLMLKRSQIRRCLNGIDLSAIKDIQALRNYIPEELK